MDEISYWIYTKRAPCLMAYDNLLKKPEAHSSASKDIVTHSISDDTKTPSPKKKRKLSLLDDESESVKEPGNVFFETCNQTQLQQTVLSSCKSSDIDFNIKKSSVHEKVKRRGLQKKSNPALHKKNKIIASTPKVNNPRRSLRNSKKSFNDSKQLNSSFEIVNVSYSNGNKHVIDTPIKSTTKLKTSTPDKYSKDQAIAVNVITVKDKRRSDNNHENGKFEDMSDVSGFTANYIRSTKIVNNKNGKNMKAKRSLVKESQCLQKGLQKTVACVNKSMNTGLPKNMLNYSTDSSQNCINLVSRAQQDKTTKVDKSTSLLKFVDTKPKTKDNKNNGDNNKKTLNASQQSADNSASRYPKRNKNNTRADIQMSLYKCELKPATRQFNKKRKVCKSSSDNEYVEIKENPGDISRTRSGRSALPRGRSEHSLLVLSNATASSAVTMNVAVQQFPANNKSEVKKKVSSPRRTRRKISLVKSEQSAAGRQSSGFAACFSDSDDDRPLKTQKYFC